MTPEEKSVENSAIWLAFLVGAVIGGLITWLAIT